MPPTVVAHVHDREALDRRTLTSIDPLPRGVLDGVGDEIEEDLLEPDGVAEHRQRRGPGGEPDLRRIGHHRRHLDRLADDRRKVDRAGDDLELAAPDPADVEQPVHQLVKSHGLGDRPAGVQVGLGRVAACQPSLDQLEVVVDGSGRRLELVPGGGHQPFKAQPHRTFRDVPDGDRRRPMSRSFTVSGSATASNQRRVPSGSLAANSTRNCSPRAARRCGRSSGRNGSPATSSSLISASDPPNSRS